MFPGDFFGGLFFVLEMVLLAAIFIVLMIVLIAVIGRRVPDLRGRRAEAAYLFSTTFAIGLLGLAAMIFTADAVANGIAGTERCGLIFVPRVERVVPTPIPRPGFTFPGGPNFGEDGPDFEDLFPDFEFTFRPAPQPTVEPASLEIRPQPAGCVAQGRAATARGVRGAMYLGVTAVGVVWFGNRARELVAKEKADDA